MATYRERREARAEKREEWAQARSRRAAQRFDTAHAAIADIPLGQPILVDHYSARRHINALERHDSNMRAGFVDSNMADKHSMAAATIREQLDRSVYSDDEDAEERLEARIAELEAQREAIKQFNATARKGRPDMSLLSPELTASLESVMRHCAYQLGKGGSFPAYVSANLSGNIKRNRDRLAIIKGRKAAEARAQAAPNGVLFTWTNDRSYLAIRFAEKPDRSVIDDLKTAGFRWVQGAWNGYASSLPASVAALETSIAR